MGKDLPGCQVEFGKVAMDKAADDKKADDVLIINRAGSHALHVSWHGTDDLIWLACRFLVLAASLPMQGIRTPSARWVHAAVTHWRRFPADLEALGEWLEMQLDLQLRDMDRQQLLDADLPPTRLFSSHIHYCGLAPEILLRLQTPRCLRAATAALAAQNGFGPPASSIDWDVSSPPLWFSFLCDGYPPFLAQLASPPPVVQIRLAAGSRHHVACRWSEFWSSIWPEPALVVGGVGCRRPLDWAAAWAAEIGSRAGTSSEVKGCSKPSEYSQPSMISLSGGAIGCDQIFGNAARQAGGLVVHWLPHGLAVARSGGIDNAYLMPMDNTYGIAGPEIHLSICEPHEPFSTARAMERNRFLYDCSQIMWVFSSRRGQGGAWQGASAALRRGGYLSAQSMEATHQPESAHPGTLFPADTGWGDAIKTLGAKTSNAVGTLDAWDTLDTLPCLPKRSFQPILRAPKTLVLIAPHLPPQPALCANQDAAALLTLHQSQYALSRFGRSGAGQCCDGIGATFLELPALKKQAGSNDAYEQDAYEQDAYMKHACEKDDYVAHQQISEIFETAKERLGHAVGAGSAVPVAPQAERK